MSAAIMAVLVWILGSSVSSPQAAAAPTRPPAAAFVDAGTCLDAALAPFAAPGAAGQATLCDDGHDLRITLQAIGLPSDEQHSAWLAYRFTPTTCRDTACHATDGAGDDPAGAMQQIGRVTSQPDGTLELQSTLRDVRLLHGAEITVQLVGELGKAGPYLQAQVAVP